MSNQFAMGYFAPSAPVAPPAPPPPPPPAPMAPPVAPAYPAPYGAQSWPAAPAQTYGAPANAPWAGMTTTPNYPGQPPAVTYDTWVPTSAADPYVAGMRTSGSALAAVVGSGKAAINAQWNAMMKARAAAGLSRNAKTLQTAGRSAASKATYMSGKGFGAAKAAVRSPGLAGAFRHTFLSVGNVARAVGGAAIFAVPIALVTNFLDFQAGKITEQQRNSLIVADIAGYTATGATSTLIGGFVGSTFFGPIIGTVVGVGAGFALGWVYEKFIRPRWGEWVRSQMYPAVAPIPMPTPTPVDPYPPPK